MKISFSFSFLAAVLLSLLSYRAEAQRLIPGQMTVYAEGSGWMVSGGGAGVSFIKRNFKWDVALQYRIRNNHLSLPETKDYYAGEYDIKAQDIYARLMYKRLIAHNRSYSWNFWVGASLDAGVRYREPLEEYADKDRISRLGFVYGFTPELSVEFFPARVFSMSVFARPRLMFLGAKEMYGERWFYPEFGMQFNFCFFTKK